MDDLKLRHHGILGQKWGIRRYQNSDGSLTVEGRKRKQHLIKEQLGLDVDENRLHNDNYYDKSKGINLKKGQNVYHITPKHFNKLNDGQELYVSALDSDRDMYKSYLSMMLKHKGFGLDTPIKELEISLKKDLSAPSSDEQKKIFENLYDTNKNKFDSDMDEYYLKKDKRPNDVYEAFIKSLDSKHKKDSKNIFYDELKNKGYNAVLDEHDINGSWMNAKQPLIVMNAMDVLGDIKVNEINNDEIIKSLKNLGVLD